MIRSLLEAAAEVNIRQVTLTDQACCVAVRLLLESLYSPTLVLKAPAAWWHLNLEGGAPGAWSPLDATERSKLGRSQRDLRTQPPAVGELLVCQGWRGTPLAPGVSGHTFVWFQCGRGGVFTGWQFDSVVGRRLDARVRPWSEVLAEFPHLRGSGLRPTHEVA